MRTAIEWVSVADGLPGDGAGVVAAVTGRYPDDDDFWLVLPMYFRRQHPVEETGEVLENCFVDADSVVRFPSGGPSAEVVTHWAELPNLPGADVRQIYGAGVRDALRRVAAG